MAMPQPPAASDEIAFFDVETTVPSRAGQRHVLLEFGAVLVCPRRLVEVDHYTTLIRPHDLSTISTASVRCNGITREQAESAPPFAEVADRIHAILHGRVWAGHNIARFDCLRVREAFAGIGRPAPEPKGIIDSYPLLSERFGKRAGNMKMATLAAYFGLGQQKHRSLDDVRMNIEVVKYCATVLFLESVSTQSSLTRTWISQTAPNTGAAIFSPYEGSSHMIPACTSTPHLEENILSLCSRTDSTVQDQAGSSMQTSQLEPLPLEPLIEQMGGVNMETDNRTENFPTSENCSWYSAYLDADRISNLLIHVAPAVSSHQSGSRLSLLYNNEPLQLRCMGLKVHFRLSRKFTNHAGWPKLSIVLDAPASLGQLLDFCDVTAQRASANSGSSSEWRPFNKKNSHSGFYTIRLNIPTISTDAATICMTEIYEQETHGNNKRFISHSFDSGKLDSLFVPGSIVDAYFSVDTYDYQQFAGIRLVAKRLVVHTNANI